MSSSAPNARNGTLTVVAAHVVRDTVYMDGGSIWWLPGMDDGTFAPTVKDSEYLGAGVAERH